jgi:hypothetical protein
MMGLWNHHPDIRPINLLLNLNLKAKAKIKVTTTRDFPTTLNPILNIIHISVLMIWPTDESLSIMDLVCFMVVAAVPRAVGVGVGGTKVLGTLIN